MSNFTHTDIREKLQELERPARKEHQKRERDGYREIKTVVDNLGRALNGGTRRGGEPKPCETCQHDPGITAVSADTLALAFTSALTREHRYLQNELIQALIMALGNMPEVEGTDARNEFAIGLCKDIRFLFKDKLFWRSEVKA